jgi:hypothetical protein
MDGFGERWIFSPLFSQNFLRKFTKMERISEMMEEKSERKDLLAMFYKK